MRARYTAFATQQIEFILDSHHPETRNDVDRDAVARSSKASRWLGLEVLRTEEGLAGDERGWVEFVARYRLNGRELVHHELSLFERHQGRWYFHSGHEPKHAEPVAAPPKVGRNEPCPCGSGKKHKKCCGAAA
jgi:SEC-C motif domain protein